jgi:hypothetical protein
MVDTRHPVGVNTPQAVVYDKSATVEGWRVAGPGRSTVTQASGKLRFFFGGENPAAVMEIEALKVSPSRGDALTVVRCGRHPPGIRPQARRWREGRAVQPQSIA